MLKKYNFYIPLFFIIFCWAIIKTPQIIDTFNCPFSLKSVSLIIALYIFSHALRLIRLSLIMANDRLSVNKILSAHIITAFPSSLFPLKLGESIRLASFLFVLDSRYKAVSLWLVERFLDILVIIFYIYLLYTLKIEISNQIQFLFIAFIGLSLTSAFLVIAGFNVISFMERYLILKSNSRKGLIFLKITNKINLIKENFSALIKDRLPALIFITLLIWAVELLCIIVFKSFYSSSNLSISNIMASILLGDYEYNSTINKTEFDIYHSIGLIIMIIILLIIQISWVLIKKRGLANESYD